MTCTRRRGDLNLVVGQKLNTTLGGDLQERIQGIRRSIAPKAWLGGEGVNVLQVLCDLLVLVEQMSIQIAAPIHASSLQLITLSRSAWLLNRLKVWPVR